MFIVGLAPPDRSVRIWGLFGSNTATAFASQFMFSCDIHRTYGGACRAQRRRLPTWRAWELSPIYGDFTGFPHAILTSGARDLFLSLTMLTHRKLRRWASSPLFAHPVMQMYQSPFSKIAVGLKGGAQNVYATGVAALHGNPPVVTRNDGFPARRASRYLISPRMVSASQLCSVAKLVMGKGCAGPGTNFWTNPVWPKKAGQKARSSWFTC